MKSFKRFTAIILCAILAFTAIPMSAFATGEPYVEIKFANGENSKITFDETKEVYIEYDAGEYEDYEIDWQISTAHRLKTKYITDEQTGHITRAKIKGTCLGGYSITVKILDKNGNEIASAKEYFSVVESENKSLKEKLHIFFINANFVTFFTTFFLIVPIVFGPIITPISFLVNVITEWLGK